MGLARLGPPAEHRRVVHDHAVPPSLHALQRAANTPERAGQGHVEDLRPLLVGHVHEVRRAPEPRVVDHDVERTDCRFGVGEHRVDLRLVGDVADHRVLGTELLRALGEPPLVARR